MERKQVFPAREEEHRQPVIVEVTAEGTARIRQAPEDVLVMVVESKEIGPQAKRLLAAGAGGEMLAPDTGETNRSTTRQIAVSFPG